MRCQRGRYRLEGTAPGVSIELEGIGEKAGAGIADGQRERIMQLLKTQGPLRTTELALALGLRRRRTQIYLQELREAGTVQRTFRDAYQLVDGSPAAQGGK